MEKLISHVAKFEHLTGLNSVELFVKRKWIQNALILSQVDWRYCSVKRLGTVKGMHIHYMFVCCFCCSLGPLVSKVKEYQVETIVDNLCNNMLSEKEQLRDISNIGKHISPLHQHYTYDVPFVLGLLSHCVGTKADTFYCAYTTDSNMLFDFMCFLVITFKI